MKKINLGFSGHKHTEETKKRISESHKGKILTEEHRRKLSEANRGKKFSEETKRKMKKPHSEDTKKKISISLKGRKLSEECKRKISKALKGRPCKSGFQKGQHSKSEFKKGKLNSNWKGGLSFKPYSIDWTETLRISIRERDKYLCQLCGKKQGDKTFHIHHKDYNKQNCNPINLITLCRKCHMKTNNKRQKWIKFFSK